MNRPELLISYAFRFIVLTKLTYRMPVTKTYVLLMIASHYDIY